MRLGNLLIKVVTLMLISVLSVCWPSKAGAGGKLLVFCGSAVTPPLEKAAQNFQQIHNIQINIHSGGSGTVLSQMRVAQRGDLYIPGSPDFMLRAVQYKSVYPETIKRLAYLIPVINVPKGNPKKISSLEDLSQPNLRLGIANPESVCVGLYAVELLEYNKLTSQIRPNIVTHAASCELTASLVVLKAVDAVLGWDIFGKWRPDKIENIYLKPNQIPRIAYIPAAISRYTKERPDAETFLEYLASDEVKDIFSQHGYQVDLKEVRAYAPRAQLGGQYTLPDNW
jgi:molybdate transport system substrate-binding protein